MDSQQLNRYNNVDKIDTVSFGMAVILSHIMCIPLKQIHMYIYFFPVDFVIGDDQNLGDN